MMLFRQAVIGDWAGPLERLRGDLGDAVVACRAAKPAGIQFL
jgi:hypothetical protein